MRTYSLEVAFAIASLLTVRASVLAQTGTATSYHSYSVVPNGCVFDDDGNCGTTESFTIYSTVVIEGSMTGSSYRHTYYNRNDLSGSDGSFGTSNGTWTQGPTTWAVSFRHDNSIPARADIDYTFLSRGYAYCEFLSSVFYDSGLSSDYIAH